MLKNFHFYDLKFQFGITEKLFNDLLITISNENDRCVVNISFKTNEYFSNYNALTYPYEYVASHFRVWHRLQAWIQYRVSKSVKIVVALITSLLVVAIVTLHLIRKRFDLPGHDVVSAIMDCFIPFMEGGNLRMEHRLERWLFGIFVIGAIENWSNVISVSSRCNRFW